MEQVVEVYETAPGLFWTRFVVAFCATCGKPLSFAYHGNPRWVEVKGARVRVIQRYYKCRNRHCTNRMVIVARHPEILPFKSLSRSTFARVAYLAHVRGFSLPQVLGELPWLKRSTCYEVLNTFRAACRASADARIAKAFPPGTKIKASVDAMEAEKGQPALYMIREVTSGILLAAAFFEVATAEAIRDLLAGVERKYGLAYKGFLSDKGKNIEAALATYYPGVPHQLCVVHFLTNVTRALEAEDLALQTGVRKEVRDLSVFKTITAKQDPGTPGLAEKEREVLADTKRAVMAVANQKKKGLFDFPGLGIYRNLTRVVEWMDKSLQGRLCHGTSRKFQVIVGHLIQKLKVIAGKYRETFQVLSQASELVRPVFKAVTDPHPKHPDRAFKKVVKSWETALAGKTLLKNARGMIEAALKFARSYGDGLFAGRKVGLPAHNNGHEAFHNKKKRRYRKKSGTKCIGPTLEISGPEEMFVPLDLTEAEIRVIVNEIGSAKYQQVLGEMAARRHKRQFNRACRKDPIKMLKKIFKNLKEDQ